MKTLWTVIGVIVLIAIIYLLYKNINKQRLGKSDSIPIVDMTPIPQVKKTVQNNTAFNPYPQDYLNSYGNPELVRMVKAGIAAKTYVYECTKKNPDGTVTITTGYSSNSSGNCGVGFTEKIIKQID